MTQIVITVIIAGLLPIVCAGIAKWGFKSYDNREPRAWLATQSGWRARANAAQQNSLEAFPMFAAAVIFALIAKADASLMIPVCWFFIACRVLYIYCYVSDKASMRSFVWFLGIAATLRLFLFAM